VSFSTTAGSVASAVAVTDANGEAKNSITTSRTATVTAQAGGASGDGSVSATVEITAVALPTVTVTPSPAAPFAGQTVTFAITATAADGTTIRTITIDYGDGRVDTSGPISSAAHLYNSAGTYRVTVTAEDSNGGRNSGSTTIVVAPASPILASLTASPTTTTTGTVVTFTVSVTQNPNNIPVSNVLFDFGDGTGPRQVASLQTSHSYGVTGTFLARATVRFQNGQSAEGNAAVIVR
jgi:PKD repeat protein